MTGPSLQDLLETVCNPPKQHLCLPYGQCYGFDSYCDHDERSVVSCFPDEVKDDKVALLKWCRDVQSSNGSFDLSPQCQAACFIEFGCSRLYPPPESSNVWMIACFICVAILMLSLTLNIVLLLKSRFCNKAGYTRMNTKDDSQMANMEFTESTVDDRCRAANLSPVDLRRQRSLNEEENALGDTTSMQSGTAGKSLDNASASTDSGFATVENSEDQQPSIGVTVRDSTGQMEEERHQGRDGQYQHSSGDDGRSLGGSQSSSSSASSINDAVGEQRGGSSGCYASQTPLDTVDAENRRQRAHHAPETIAESRDLQTPVVTNLQSYNRE